MSIINVNEIVSKDQNNEESDEEEIECRKNIINIFFKTTQGIQTNVGINSEESIGKLLLIYLTRIGRQDLIIDPNNLRKICFLHISYQLKFNDNTKIKDFFKGNPNPKVIVNDVDNMIGA